MPAARSAVSAVTDKPELVQLKGEIDQTQDKDENEDHALPRLECRGQPHDADCGENQRHQDEQHI